MVSPRSLPPAADTEIERNVVTVRNATPDPYDGLKGHDYINARNLNRPVQRVQTSAQSDASSDGGEQ